MKINFLNVDLEIESHQDLQPIVHDFGEDAINLYCGKAQGHYVATFEAPHTADVDAAIAYFCALVDALEEETKVLWETAFTKVFDVGYESGLEPRSYLSEIRADTIQKVAALGAALRITIYPPAQQEL
ncbi:MAG: hypothetical protein F6K42_33020 [Leptolyngbya sp. SIO1D8]|nr:hypothetical protein [Leptolyngbya sp. SIO1D8]